MENTIKINVHFDGGYRSRNGAYASVAYLEEGTVAVCGGVVDTTNNRMEMTGFISGIRAAVRLALYKYPDTPIHITVHGDSQYVIKGVEEWLPTWQKKGILEKKLNVDLWEQVIKTLKVCEDNNVTLEYKWAERSKNKTCDAKCTELILAKATGERISCVFKGKKTIIADTLVMSPYITDEEVEGFISEAKLITDEYKLGTMFEEIDYNFRNNENKTKVLDAIGEHANTLKGSN